MYDCEQDRYTDFATAPTRRSPSLRGELCAIHHGSSEGARLLTSLLAWASERQLDVSLQQGKLQIADIDINQALQINRLFGNGLIISCHLRRNPPAAIA